MTQEYHPLLYGKSMTQEYHPLPYGKSMTRKIMTCRDSGEYKNVINDEMFDY